MVGKPVGLAAGEEWRCPVRSEAPMSELALIALVGGVTVLMFLYLRRIEGSAAAPMWAFAWVFLWAAGLLTVVDESYPVALGMAHWLGSLFSVLLLAGALTFSGHHIPRWLLPAGVGLGALRFGLQLLGEQTLSYALVPALEVPACAAAAILVSRRARRPPAFFAERLLGPALGLIAILNGVDAVTRAVGGSTLFLVSAWIFLSVAIALLQVIAIMDRLRASEHEAVTRRVRDLALLRRIAEAATHESTVSMCEEITTAVREHLEFDGAGIWLVARDGRSLEYVCGFGLPEPLPASLQRLVVEQPLARLVLASTEPVLLDDLANDPRLEEDAARQLKLRGAALLPLSGGGRSIGVLVAGMRGQRSFDEVDRRLLSAATEEITLALGHVRGVEERNRQARMLDAERRTLWSVLETAPVGVCVVDPEGRVAIVNRLGVRHAGLDDAEEAIGEDASEFFRSIASQTVDRRAFLDVFAATQRDADRVIDGLEVTLPGPPERILVLFSSPVVSESGLTLGRVWVSRDVSDERRLEAELRQSQKMETLGTLAGGVAHDFNNQLTTILGNARLLLEEAGVGSSQRPALLDLERAAEHCSELTRGLLTFARRTPVQPRPLDVEHLLHEVESMLRAGLASTIQLSVEAAPDLKPAFADPTELKQVVFNLAVNAQDALEGHGHLVLRAGNREVEARAAHEVPEARPGRYVEITVQDDGPGIPAEVRQRIFDPFFTTKGVGKGTGLGLAIAYGVVRSHGGWLEVESEPGRGSTFRALIPTALELPRPAEPDTATFAPQGTETILVADDEQAVLRLVGGVLERLGYRVLLAEDGIAAVTRFREAAGEIALVILDVTMPRQGGAEALAAIQAMAPKVPAILVSGHFAPDSDLVPEGVHHLAKPFRPNDLGRIVREVLDATDPTG
jgi:signal transduction histidine kinase